MTDAAVARSDRADAREAGLALGQQLATALPGPPPDVVIAFVSAAYDYEVLLSALDATCQPRLLVGCSSAGEFTGQSQGVGSASAVAIRSSGLKFAARLGRGLRSDTHTVAERLFEGLRGSTSEHPFRYALVLTDALAGQTDELIDDLTRLTAGTYQFFGGGAGDDGRFIETHVFCGTEVVSDAAVILEILSNAPLGIGVRHGWRPAGPAMRVTEADGMRVVSLNAEPAADAFGEHAHATGQHFDPSEPFPFFLQNVIGVETAAGHKLRVPLGLGGDGSVACAADVPAGATVHIMGPTAHSAAEAAANATRDAVSQLGGRRPKVALFFDCVATRLRTGLAFESEIDAVRDALGPTAIFGGCNTYGQIARAEGQFSGFHNCTAVVCVLPE